MTLFRGIGLEQKIRKKNYNDKKRKGNNDGREKREKLIRFE